MSKKFWDGLNRSELERLEPGYTIPFLRTLQMGPETRVLDIGGFGCGGLNTSIHFVREGCRIQALNLDPGVEDLCNQFGVQFINEDLLHWNTDQRWDIIMSELPVEIQIQMLEEGHIDRMLNWLLPGGILLTHFTDDLTRFPIGENWILRKEEMTPTVQRFKESLGGQPVEDYVTQKYPARYLGPDHSRPFMKWFQIGNL